jgi:excisionase family DNA binding protein
MEQHNESPSSPLLLTIPQVAQSLALSRASVYKLIATHELPVMRFGRAVRVSAASLYKWVQEREQRG